MLLQLMKTRHAKLGEPDLLSVFVGTWNMGREGAENQCDHGYLVWL